MEQKEYEKLHEALERQIGPGMFQAVLSNARYPEISEKTKIRPVMIRGQLLFQKTDQIGPKVFHENFSAAGIIREIEEALDRNFRQLALESKSARLHVLVSKKGKLTIRETILAQGSDVREQTDDLQRNLAHNRKKTYLLPEGTPVPFLIDLGVQTPDGRITKARYDKFRQINRFLEFVEDILPALPKDRPVRIIDFGCGKSYLTFAVYYYLHEKKGYNLKVTGLDLKEDVIEKCAKLAVKYGYTDLSFEKGNIKDYTGADQADMVITLHACDTATDFAIEKAVKWGAKVILSVPCCQHEVNKQIRCEALEAAQDYGIIKERMSALFTDALRAKKLECCGYKTQILEFIDMEHTPKNLLIRAVKEEGGSSLRQQKKSAAQLEKFCDFLQIEPTLLKLLP